MVAEPDTLLGRTLEGRYRVRSPLGRGGMGEVYLAEHLLLGSEVALKVLSGERASDPVAVRRFLREARSAFRIDHPHAVRVTDLGADGGLLYIAMEYLDGRTLGIELDVDGPVAATRAVHIGRQVAEVLAHAHRLGLVHRDLKPDNLMLVRRDGDPDFVKVLDFGLSRIFDEHGDLAGTAISLAPLTAEGLVFGTPDYMSPEQASGQKVGPASDVYSLGAVLYHAVTGEVPFTGRTFTEVLARHVREAPVAPSARRPDLVIPPAVDEIVLGCLAKRAEDRPAGAAELGARLERIGAELARSAGRRVAAVAASETMDLPAARVAEGIDSAAVVAEAVGRRRRGVVLAVGALALGGLLAVGVAASLSSGARVAAGAEPGSEPDTGSDPEPDTGSDPEPDTGSDPEPDPDFDPDSDPDRNPDSDRDRVSDRDSDPGSDGGSARDRGSDPGSQAAAVEAGAPPSGRRNAERAAEQHVRAAEEARRAGNLLRQLAEADQARRLDPRNRRAAELVGEALVKSGDPARGCPLLRRSRWKRDLGCPD